MNKLIGTLTLAGCLIGFPATALADEPDEGCVTVDYQGAPLEMCPIGPEDPTRCYTGWYQGAPIENCLRTDQATPDGVILHNKAGYVPPAPATTAAAAPGPAPVPSVPALIEPDPFAWVIELQAALVANGGW